jgi:hypothetical protein
MHIHIIKKSIFFINSDKYILLGCGVAGAAAVVVVVVRVDSLLSINL